MKKVFVFLLVFSNVYTVVAQVLPQNGSATFNLPMFNWSDDHSRLNALVALNYSSGNGLKVNDVASDVGQGWNLTAGGVITRMQVGLPDDQQGKGGYGSTETSPEDPTKYPPGFLYDPVLLSSLSSNSGCPIGLTKYPLYKDKNHLYRQHNAVGADKELDYFAFQINGRTALFVLGKSNGQFPNLGVLVLGDTRLKVWYDKTPTAGIRTTISVFYLQDENGLIYKFSKPEFTKVLKYSFCDEELIESHTQPKLEGGNVYHEAAFPDNNIADPLVINSWYLTEIKDPLTQRVITYRYNSQNRNITADAGTSISYYKEKGYAIISHHKSVTQTPELSAIVFPDGHQVNFNYGKSRVDLVGAKALESIDILYFNRYISKYSLTTSYFILNRYGNANTAYQRRAARLCLLSVKRFGVDLKGEERPYLFDYYMGSNSPDDIVPPPFSHIKDLWGFYNGDNSRDASNAVIDPMKLLRLLPHTALKRLCFLADNSTMILNAKSGYAKNGLLKQIIYPTGGALTYEYAQNEMIIGANTVPAAGVHVSKTNLTDGGYSNDCNNPIVTNYAYKLESSNQSSLWGLEEPMNYTQMKSHYVPEDKYVKFDALSLNLTCDYRYKYPGILSRDQAISLESGMQFKEILSKALDIVSGILTVVDVVNLCLAATPANWVAVIIDIIASAVTLVLSCTANVTQDETNTVYYNYDLQALNPLPSQFRRVEVTESSGGNGRTVMEFTSSGDYAVWEPSNASLSMRQRFAPWAYGLPKRTTILDASGNKVKETENLYNFAEQSVLKRTFSTHGVDAYPSCKCVVKESSSQRNTVWQDPITFSTAPDSYTKTNIPGILEVEMYKIYTGRVDLTDTYERVYKPSDQTQYLQTHTKYAYNSNFQVREVRTTESNGTERVKRVTYSGDYGSGVFTGLNTQNIISLPVSTGNYMVKPGGDIFLLNESVIEYDYLANGDVKPSRTLERRFSQPVSQPFVGADSYQGPGSPSNPTDYKQTQTFIYNSSNVLVGMKDEGQRMITNIYDYNDKYVVASVVNADPVLDHAAYSSFESSGFGGWTLSGSATYQGISVVGINSFVLTGTNSLTSNLNNAKPYKLSFYANNTVSITAGAVLEKSVPAINGFTYYEYNVAAGTSAITLSGTANIDELRLYPSNARMRTVTYDPLIGKTAECDENSRVTYYEYDALGRLQFIKDEKKNITKMYEYNQVSKQAGCTVTYYNKAISEVYTKNNCPSGKGSDVVYTIPANTYSSTISQEAADQLAENDLDANAQGYANSTGTCVQVFVNGPISQSFTKQGCAVGTVGTTVLYTVPGGKYSSTIDVADANRKAQAEIDANGQAFANLPGNASCVADNTPVWEGTGVEQCQSGYKMVQVKDMNPNSSTYNQTQLINSGIDPSCPGAWINIQYDNLSQSQIVVEFLHPSTNAVQYSFTMTGSNGTMAVLQGSYKVRMYDPANVSHVYDICGEWKDGIDETFLGVNISTLSCNYFIVD